MKKNVLCSLVFLLLATYAQAGLNIEPLVNASFENTSGTDEVNVIDWWDAVNYTTTVVENGTSIPETPYGETWGQLGNGRWLYQQIGTYEEDMILEVSFLIGQRTDKAVAGLEVELFAGGNASLVDNVNAKRDSETFPLDSVVGAVQLSASGNIDPFTDTALGTMEMSVQLSTGTVAEGYAVGDPLWLLFSRPSVGGKGLIDNVAVAVVPEPATMSLLALGAFGLIRRKRK